MEPLHKKRNFKNLSTKNSLIKPVLANNNTTRHNISIKKVRLRKLALNFLFLKDISNKKIGTYTTTEPKQINQERNIVASLPKLKEFIGLSKK